MKAVVLSKQNNECIVLADDESMHTVPATITGGSELNVGDVFELAPYVKPERPGRRRMYRIAAAAAVFCIAMVGMFYYTTFTVSATVTTEGEAPITYYLNHWGKVLRAEPQNAAAEAVLEDMGDLGTRPDLVDVLEMTAASMQKQGLLGEEDELAYAVDKGDDGKVDERGTVPPPKTPETTAPSYAPAPDNNKDDSDKESKEKKTTEKKKPTKPTNPSKEPTPAPTDPTPAPTDPTNSTQAPPDDPGGGDNGGGGNDNGGGNNDGGNNGGGNNGGGNNGGGGNDNGGQEKAPPKGGNNGDKSSKPPAKDNHQEKPGKANE